MFFDEPIFPNAYCRKVVLVSIKGLNMLETSFLLRINFQLGIETSPYEAYNERLILQSFIMVVLGSQEVRK